MSMSPDNVKTVMGQGLLSFPVTHFRPDFSLDLGAFTKFVDTAVAAGPSGLFVAGGTGEFFSLTLDEYRSVVKAAIEVNDGRIAMLSGAGYGTATAVEYAKAAEQGGADGILVMPQYLVGATQEGLFEHASAICRSVGIAVVLYNRDNAIYAPQTVARLAEAFPNLVGFKDGHGDMEQLALVTALLGDRLTYIGGMPTAEVFATSYLAAGFTTYSSAIFNFVPRFAQRYYKAVREQDTAFITPLIRDFFAPYLAIRNRRSGYPVAIVKAGLRLVGRDAGPVRSPLVDLTDADMKDLAPLVAKLVAMD